jgi:hypothetical protein
VTPEKGIDMTRLVARVHAHVASERGDVPGWVLITIMTAGIVAVLWQFAEPYLRDVLADSLDATVGR